MTAALITGLSGLTLTNAERDFLAEVRPAGIILFKRNARDAEQIKRLVQAARDAIARDDVLVLIDQEGGRVQRLRAPLATDLPAAAAFAKLYQKDAERACDAARCVAHLNAVELSAFGINTNCAPVLDVPVAGAHDVIGDRAYGSEPSQIIALARAVADGLRDGGVLPVIKHIPGHGRSTADSHFDLPVVSTTHEVLAKTDFVPFKALADIPAAMTAHVVFSALDPNHPASTSEKVTGRIIRKEIGFDGLLMSDDLSMRALKGPIAARAEAVLKAGSDVALHCNGDIGEMRAAAGGVGMLAGKAKERFDRAVEATRSSVPLDKESAVAALQSVISSATRGV